MTQLIPSFSHTHTNTHNRETELVGVISSINPIRISGLSFLMTTPDSTSSGAESTTMDESNSNNQTITTDDDIHNDKTGGDAAGLWGNFTDSFRQVQSVLDRNRVLIEQVNENHRSKIHEKMVQNVALIQEINSNISKVVSLYSHLSTNFSSVFHQRNDGEAADANDVTTGGVRN